MLRLPGFANQLFRFHIFDVETGRTESFEINFGMCS